MNEIEKIYTAQDNIQAEMIIEALKNNQINALKEDIGSSGIMNVYTGNSKYGEDIFVAQKDAAKARQVLQDMGLEAELC